MKKLLSLSTLLVVSTGIIAQNFLPVQTNPFNLTDVGGYAALTFADLDNDGDLDLLAGETTGNFHYFRNDGNSTAPSFAVDQVNPFGLTDIGVNNVPTFGDLDGDGDYDVLVGENDGNFRYFQNIGTNLAPSFLPFVTNPFGLSDIGTHANPVLVDLDNDGKLDVFAGRRYGNAQWFYFRNVGTALAPAFAPALGDPFGLTSVGSAHTDPAMGDLDGDGDLDLMVGRESGTFIYFRNNGNSVNPAFSSDWAPNPFGVTGIGAFSKSTFVDLDNDGDLDLMANQSDGNFKYFENAFPSAALNFDGSNDYVSIPNSATTNFAAGKEFTIEFWLKAASDIGNQTFICKGGSIDQEQFSFDNYGASFRFYVESTTQGNFSHLTMTRINSSEGWVHVAGTYNGNTQEMRLYKNGVLMDQTNSAVNSLMAAVYPTFIGIQQIAPYSAPANTSIDEVRFWSRALCQGEIQSNMNCELNPAGQIGLGAVYHFNQGTSSSNNAGVTGLTDASGNGNTGTLVNFTLNGTTSNWIAPGAVIIGTSCGAPSAGCFPAGALQFGGASDNVTIGSLGSISDFTIETWIKPAGANNYENIFHSDFPASGAASQGVRLEMSQNFTEGHLYVSVSGDGSFIPHTIIPLTSNLSTNWQHIAIVGDRTNNRLRVYLDGVLVFNDPHTNWPNSFGNFVLGRGLSPQWADRNYNGQLDEFRVWTTARTQTEILANMNCEISGTVPCLEAYYNFNNTNATTGSNNTGQTTLTDNSGNGHTGTLNSFALTAGSTSNWSDQVGNVSGNCGAIYCNPTWLGASNTAWTTGANWSTGSVPLATDDITIPNVPNDPVISTAITTATIDLQSGATLAVASGGTLTLNGALTNSGAVTIQNGGSFLQGGSSSITGAGTFSVQRQGSAANFNFWSSPITSQNGVPGTSYEYIAANSTQDESDDANDPGWSSYNGTMTPGKGYAGNGGNLATFTGIPNNGTVNLGGLHAATYDPSFTATTGGSPFNLVGNPYPSAISANSFIAANTDDIFGTLYFWIDDLSGGSGYNRTDYAYWNGAGGLGTSPGSQGAPSGNIASCQGFLVRVKDAATAPYDISFNNAMRMAGNNGQFLKTDGEYSRLWFGVEHNDNFDQILIALMDDATEDEDDLYDAIKLNTPNSIAIAAMGNGLQHAIQAMPHSVIDRTVPLKVEVTEAGTYNFKANTMENFDSYTVYFEDVQTGTSVLLEGGVAIPVVLAVGEHNNRFYLNFVRTSFTGIGEEGQSPLSVYEANDVLHVLNAATATNASIELLDMSGRLVMSHTQTLGTGDTNVSIAGLSTGVYLVRITSETETVAVKILKD